MLITLDRYYSADFYNGCIQALINNKIPVKQFISSTTYKWYLDVPYAPLMVNYDVMPEGNRRYLLSKTIAVNQSDQYKLYRRIGDYGVINPVMVKADYMLSDKQYACFFNLRNRFDGNSLSKLIKDRIYYLGKYYANKYRLCVCTNPSIRPLLAYTDVLYEKKETVTWVQAELDINMNMFMFRDYLMKFTVTPYFFNGKFETPSYFGDFQRRFFTI